MLQLAPHNPKDRFEAYRFFNGISAESKEYLNHKRLSRPLVKSFLLEHVSKRNGNTVKSPEQIFGDLGVDVKIIDDDFMELTGDVIDPESKKTTRQKTGYLEKYDERFFAYYTCEASGEAKKRVTLWAQSADLDHTWFTGPLMQELWEHDISKRGDRCFGKLVFNHESIFDMPSDFSIDNSNSGADDFMESLDGREEDSVEFERRKARFEMKDRVGEIRKSLKALQENYSPLHALNALRLPSRTGRGGDDLYQNGQLTNRTDSFESHRNSLHYLYRIYKEVLDFTEESAWSGTNHEQAFKTGVKGAPLIIQFKESLPKATFDKWIQMAFRKQNRFKLWGNAIRLGPTKVHVYGADRHLWQPINMEITEKGMVAILPRGTCGNTFHRLVANVQHYVSPQIKAWVGEKTFSEVVSRGAIGKVEPDEN